MSATRQSLVRFPSNLTPSQPVSLWCLLVSTGSFSWVNRLSRWLQGVGKLHQVEFKTFKGSYNDIEKTILTRWKWGNIKHEAWMRPSARKATQQYSAIECKTSAYRCLQLSGESMKCNYPSAPKKNKTELQHERGLQEKHFQQLTVKLSQCMLACSAWGSLCSLSVCLAGLDSTSLSQGLVRGENR